MPSLVCTRTQLWKWTGRHIWGEGMVPRQGGCDCSLWSLPLKPALQLESYIRGLACISFLQNLTFG